MRHHARRSLPPPDFVAPLITRPMLSSDIDAVLADTWGSGVIRRSLVRMLGRMVDLGQISRARGRHNWEVYYQPVGWRCGLPEDQRDFGMAVA